MQTRERTVSVPERHAPALHSGPLAHCQSAFAQLLRYLRCQLPRSRRETESRPDTNSHLSIGRAESSQEADCFRSGMCFLSSFHQPRCSLILVIPSTQRRRTARWTSFAADGISIPSSLLSGTNGTGTLTTRTVRSNSGWSKKLCSAEAVAVSLS